MSASKRRRLGSRLLLAACATVVGLSLAVVATITGLIPRELHHRLQERWAARGAETKPTRVLVLGDSLLDTWNLDRYLRRDLVRFHRRHDLGLRIMAWGGTGPHEHRAHLGEAMNQRYFPHLVVVFYNVANDLTDCMRNLPAPPPPPPPPKAGGWLAAPLRLPQLSCNGPDRREFNLDEVPGKYPDWSWMRQKGIDPELIRLAKRSLEEPDRLDDQMVSAGLLAAASTNDWFYINNVLIEGHPAPQAWEVVTTQLNHMIGGGRLAGFEVVLVIVPAMVQVSRTQEPFLRQARFALRDELFTTDRPQRRLLAWCKKESISCLDLLPILRAHPNRDKLFFKRDDHPNALGYTAIFEAVRDKVLLPWIKRRKP